jgi:hypothetical protein
VGVAVAAGSVWIAESRAERIESIDAHSNGTVAWLIVHGHPEAIDSQGGFVWAAVSAD